MARRQISKSGALRFIVLLGCVSLFADMTYEGARSITGPYLQVLGASATVVGIVAGLGELIGYALRLATGYLSDRIRKYWFLTILGYVVNLMAVPALALTNRWEWAAALIVTERLGKAIRAPARDAMLSHATALTGHGAGFGLHEAMDQIGAVAGPLLVTLLLSFREDYQKSFGFLLIPALLALATLVVARLQYPEPAAFEPVHPKINGKGFPRTYWI